MRARLLILAAAACVVWNFGAVGWAEEVTQPAAAPEEMKQSEEGKGEAEKAIRKKATHPSAAPEEMKQGEEKKGEADKAKRPEIRLVKENSEETQDKQREKAYQESRNARVKKLERTRGQKVKSWQVLNR